MKSTEEDTGVNVGMEFLILNQELNPITHQQRYEFDLIKMIARI